MNTMRCVSLKSSSNASAGIISVICWCCRPATKLASTLNVIFINHRVPIKVHGFYAIRAASINAANRIIKAVGKHVIAQQALAGGDEGIGVEEAAQFGIIIAGLEVISLVFCVVDIAASVYSDSFRRQRTFVSQL